MPITPEFICESIFSPMYSCSQSSDPDIVIYVPVYELIRPTYIDIKLPRAQGYPSFDLYEPGYPAICLYPVIYGPTKVMTLEEPKLRGVRVTIGRRVACKRLRLFLGAITLTLIQDPSIEPYTPLADKPTPQSVRLSATYPAFDLYPALDSVYPPIEPAGQCKKLSPLQHNGFVYPKIIIYQLLAVNTLGSPLFNTIGNILTSHDRITGTRRFCEETSQNARSTL